MQSALVPAVSVSEARGIVGAHDGASLLDVLSADPQLVLLDSVTISGRGEVEAVLSGRALPGAAVPFRVRDVRAFTSDVYVCPGYLLQVGSFRGRMLSDDGSVADWSARYLAQWRRDADGAWRVGRSHLPAGPARAALEPGCTSRWEERQARLLERRWTLTVLPPTGLRSGGPLNSAYLALLAPEGGTADPFTRCTAGCGTFVSGMEQGSPLSVSLRHRAWRSATVELVAGWTLPAVVRGVDPEGSQLQLTYGANHAAVLFGWERGPARIAAGPETIASTWTWSDRRWSDFRMHPVGSGTDRSVGLLAGVGYTVALSEHLLAELTGQYRLGGSRVPPYRDAAARDVRTGGASLGVAVGVRR